jgi:hypothetical protein
MHCYVTLLAGLLLIDEAHAKSGACVSGTRAIHSGSWRKLGGNRGVDAAIWTRWAAG